MRLILLGNYGVGNLGDEMLREYFLHAFPHVEWIILDGGTASTQRRMVPRLPFGLRSLMTTPWWRTLGAFRRCDAVVFGGGTLFTDIESRKAPLLWWWHALTAWMFRKRIILAFQGIGPWKTQMGEWCTRWVVERSALTVVRDEESLRRITQWKNKKYVQSCDPVLSLLSSSQDRGSGKRFVIIPRANASQEFLDLAKAEGMKAKERGETVCIASLEPEAHGEGMICGELARHLDAPIVCPSTRQELMSVMQDASYVLTQRYHGAIAALGMGIPFHAFPQASGDKLDAVAEMDRETALEAVERGERALREVLSQRI